MKNGLIVDEYGTKHWFLNDKRHRLGGPAIERVDGHKSWWVLDKRHRTDGPAVEYASGDKEWWVDDKRHRTDGPAIEWVDGTNWWYFEDRLLGGDQAGFWALWALLTPEEQNNLTLLQYMAGVK